MAWMKFIQAIFSGDESETFYEEIANSLTHILAIILSIIGIYYLITISAFQKGRYHQIGSLIYGLSLLLLYSLSSVYHIAGALKYNAHFMSRLKQMDHAAIYILIAGTYTPMILVNFIKNNGRIKLGIFGLCNIWLIALIGFFVKIFWEPSEVSLYFSIGSYIFLGWYCIFFFPILWKDTPSLVIRWLAAGGIVYTLGVIFLLWDSLQFNHAIWHLFALTASILHYISVVLLLITIPGEPLSGSTFHILTNLFFGYKKKFN